MDVLASALPWAQIGWGAIVVLVVILILRGHLVPRIFHEDLIRDRDRWRAMAEQLREENGKLLVIGELGVNSIHAIEQVVANALAEDHARENSAKKANKTKDSP